MAGKPIFMKRKPGTLTLHAADNDAAEAIAKLDHTAILTVEIRQPRNIGHHRKFWKLMSMVHGAQSDPQTWPSVESLVDAVKVALGYSEDMVLMDGSIVQKPGSIAFHKMDQQAFSEFYDQCVKLIGDKIIPRIDESDLRREIEELIA